MIPVSVHPGPGNHELVERLTRLVESFRRPRIAVVGDLIADEFIYGGIGRVSREAPVLILNYDSTQVTPGGAGNAAQNVAALGGTARLIGLLGPDEIGRRLARSFSRHVDRTGLVKPVGYRTPTKTRILAGGVHSARQQVVRIDRAGPPVTREMRAQVVEAATAAVDGCDALIVSDYGAGLVTPALVAALKRCLPRRGRRPAAPILLDSRYALLKYRGVTIAAPNESEVEHTLGIRVGDDARALERAGRELLRRTKMGAMLVTRGSRGMALFEPGRPTQHLAIYGTDEVADVTGAGDTVIATMAMALSVGASAPEAALLANYAGGLVVMKRGTATVTVDELQHAFVTDLGS
ncbi:MAG: bifunctional ADP-heptose synthase [Acidobacteria bacterium]|nr:bifunctional ADP-heptose synthase [Acidobacteriota bacterium]